LETMLKRKGFKYQKLIGRVAFDLDRAIEKKIQGAHAMWGDGEHRYILEKI